ncbi:MAG: ParB/RepB/Spo0J family partition protein, partial [Synergistota bacterium]|nr:ParB/RepB/Spo0J family partition protein [Synergistota bacterium]
MNDMNESRPGVASKRRLLEVPIDSIKPNPAQPRQYFEEAELEELAASIAAVGVIQPVVVRPSESEYELVVGERRLRAASMAGLDSIPAVIAETETRDMRVTALIENIHRSDLSAIEEAEALQSILEDTKWSQTELAARRGLSQSAVSNKRRLLKLEAPVLTLVMQGKLGERQ